MKIVFRTKALHLLAVVMLCCGLVQFGPATAAAAGNPVASGLNYPRYLAMDEAGNIYVADPGTGGDQVIKGQNGDPDGTRGSTGQILKISPSGAKTVVAKGLPSYYDPAEGSTGPEGIVYSGNYLYVTTVTVLAAPAPALPYEGSVVKIDLSTGAITKLADLGAFEKANNPDPNQIDSDPYGIAMGPDGNLYVADAAGNDLLKVNPNTGAVSLVAVIPGIALPPSDLPPGGNPERGGKAELDPVPTGVAVDTDGTIYVGLLSGFPFPKGSAKVVKVTPTGQVSDFAGGFTTLTGVAIGPDKRVYVSELSTNVDVNANPPQIDPGEVSRINADGSHTAVATGLNTPNGIMLDKAGNLYVTTGTAFGPPNAGTIVRYDGVAPVPTTSPLPNTGPIPGHVNFLTGYTLGGAFLSFWQLNGGLSVFGYPIDSEHPNDGVVAQWLERTRFEYHPEMAYPYNVLLGRLGAEALAAKGIDWTILPKVSSAPAGCRYFVETGHSLCGDFLNYWTKNGLEFDGQNGKSFQESLALFGFPISEPEMETNSSGDTVLTQWFERARFEWHPNNPAQYQVELGLVGVEVKNHSRAN